MDIDSAIEKLNTLLPLKQRKRDLSPQLKAVHQDILYSLVRHGHPLSKKELEKILDESQVEDGLAILNQADLIVLDKKDKLPLGAYPVTIEQTSHKIMVNGNSIYAMCALDAVSVAPMFDVEVKIISHCHASQIPISIYMLGHNILESKPSVDILVGIRWQIPSNVAAHSICTEMVFLKDRKTAESWQQIDSENISLFTLAEAVKFGHAFFKPLLE